MKIWIFIAILIKVLHGITTTRVFSDKQLNEFINKNSKAAFVYVHSQSKFCENCLKAMEDASASLDGNVHSLSMFCDEKAPEDSKNLEICVQYFKQIGSLPQVFLIEPQEEGKYKKHVIKIEEIDFKLLKTLAVKLSPLYSKNLLSFQDLDEFLKDSQHQFNKVLYFYKTPEISSIYKGLTTEYKGRLQVINRFFSDLNVFIISLHIVK